MPTQKNTPSEQQNACPSVGGGKFGAGGQTQQKLENKTTKLTFSITFTHKLKMCVLRRISADFATPKLLPRAVGQLKILSGCHFRHQTVPNEQQNTRPSVGDGNLVRAAKTIKFLNKKN